MIPRLLTILEAVRSSLWALPLAMVAGACLLAYAVLHADLTPGTSSAWYLYSGTADEAPQFVSNLVTSMITMATLAISITMVVLTLAAQQMGPRLIRSFMGSRRTQASLGLFVGTVVYLLLVQRSAYSLSDAIPNLAVSIGTTLVLVSVVTLLLFVHHLARSIIADNIISRVGLQLDGNIERLLPEKTEKREATPQTVKHAVTVALANGGHVQAVDYDTIVNAAAKADVVVELAIRAGQHAVTGNDLAYLSRKPGDSDQLLQAIQNSVVLGSERTAVQDIEYSVHQLVEVALRALSPGINDPYTANSVVDRLTLSISKVMTRGPAKNVWLDNVGKLRLVAPVSTFEGITASAFDQIRQHGAKMPSVLIRLAENLANLLHQADAEHRPALEKQLRLVLAAGQRNIADKEDRADLEARAEVAGIGGGKKKKARN